MSILFHFTLKLLKLNMVLSLQIYSIKTRQRKSCCCVKKFLSGVANGYLSRVLNTVITNKINDENHLAQEAISTFSFTE